MVADSLLDAVRQFLASSRGLRAPDRI